MPAVGAAAVWAALAFAVGGILLWGWARARADARLGELARVSALAMSFSVLTAVLVLWILLLEGDFRVLYVAEETSRSLPIVYRFAALWSGNAGSLLFWVGVLSGYVAWTALRRTPAADGELTLNALPFLLAIAAFYLALVAGPASPFATTSAVLYDGTGMNALLQNGWMAFHPPLLYAGYVGMSVPFALAMASLVVGRSDASWIRLSRTAATFSWLALGTGILLGAHWAYVELGWGGYWAWDPVENASFLPWLAATAFLHSLVVQERRGILRLWNTIIASIAFWLTMLGTFLTRSGVVDSVHAFAGTSMGEYFGPLLAAGSLATAAFIYARRDVLRAGRGQGVWSGRGPAGASEERHPKETAFVLNNLLFLAVIGGILFGTLFPLFSRPLFGQALAFGTQAYNRIVTPFAAGGFVLLGVATSIGWGPQTLRRAARRLLLPAAAAAAVAVLLAAAGMQSSTALAMDTTAAFAAAAVLADGLRAARARARSRGVGVAAAAVELLSQRRRRYGGYVVHLAVVLVAVGITASSVYGREAVVTLNPGQTARVGAYALTYRHLTMSFAGNRQIYTAALDVRVAGRQAGTVRPSQILFPNMPQPLAGVAIRSQGGGDLYTVLQAIQVRDVGPSGPVATFDVFVNPLVNLIWLGGALFLLGGLVVIAHNGAALRWSRIVPSLPLAVVLAIPALEIETAAARRVLPERVALQDAVFNLGHAALLVAALAQGRPDLLRGALCDRLHQPYRAPLVPGFEAVVAAGTAAGAYGAALSGSGPTVAALAPPEAAETVGEAMRAAFARAGVSSRVIVTAIESRGALDS
ncbi:MAG: cytochrome c biogenesis protein CcsA [Firmicutes bacterium]|nr:cytochrome c biogenesis protein CcsA [Bacillota bacterium]